MKITFYLADLHSTCVLRSGASLRRLCRSALWGSSSDAVLGRRSFQTGAALAILLFLSGAVQAGEVLPAFKVDNLVCTNVQVVKETPTYVLLKGEPFGFRRFNRQELPTELRDRFPYDPVQAAEYEKQEAAKAKMETEQRRRDTYNALLRREKEIQNKIDQMNKSLLDVQKQIRAWRSKPKHTPGRAKMLDRLIDQRIALEKQLADLEKQLQGVQEQQTKWR